MALVHSGAYAESPTKGISSFGDRPQVEQKPQLHLNFDPSAVIRPFCPTIGTSSLPDLVKATCDKVASCYNGSGGLSEVDLKIMCVANLFRMDHNIFKAYGDISHYNPKMHFSVISLYNSLRQDNAFIRRIPYCNCLEGVKNFSCDEINNDLPETLEGNDFARLVMRILNDSDLTNNQMGCTFAFELKKTCNAVIYRLECPGDSRGGHLSDYPYGVEGYGTEIVFEKGELITPPSRNRQHIQIEEVEGGPDLVWDPVWGTIYDLTYCAPLEQIKDKIASENPDCIIKEVTCIGDNRCEVFKPAPE